MLSARDYAVQADHATMATLVPVLTINAPMSKPSLYWASRLYGDATELKSLPTATMSRLRPSCRQLRGARAVTCGRPRRGARMTDQLTYISFNVGGMNYKFTRAAVSYAANQAARAFAFTVTDATDPMGEQWNFMPGTPVTVSPTVN
jgi:hypothetical protein